MVDKSDPKLFTTNMIKPVHNYTFLLFLSLELCGKIQV